VHPPYTIKLRRAVASALATLVTTGVLVAGASPAALAHPPGAFAVECKLSHILMDDPIVYRGEPGASHLHAFYGNKSTKANSTRRTLMRHGTTCSHKKDLAAVWFPTAKYKRDGDWRRMTAYRERTYYFPSVRDNLGDTGVIPKNIKIIGGNAHANSWRQNPAVRWFCGEGSPERPWPYDCHKYTKPLEDGFRAIVDLPFCWDGKNLDSPDHHSHVIYPNPNDRTPHVKPASCPNSHPVNIPSISIRAHFRIKDPCLGHDPCGPDSGGKNVRIRLASGPYYTMHADFWNTWVQHALNKLTRKCLWHHRECGIFGAPDTDE
jgi:hypothetical protein